MLFEVISLTTREHNSNMQLKKHVSSNRAKQSKGDNFHALITLFAKFVETAISLGNLKGSV